ncbi:MAG TPA: transposase [Clostridia bacterium]|nr:transposase [Clostridia bacterium]
MGHTYTSSIFHCVFSTKDRSSTIVDPEKLWAYLRGTAKNIGLRAIAIGGTRDHVHILLSLPANMPLAEAVQKLKANSSRWLGEAGSWPGWQKGYGAFSVSASNLAAVTAYVENQAAHHSKRGFHDEFVALLEKSGVHFDPADVFD